MSKKKEEVLIKEKDKFISRSIKNGYNDEISNKVYDLILKFASYGFNRAHSVSYAVIAIKMAYLKAHYSLNFMKELLNMVIGNASKTNEYLYECKKLNVKISKPDINISIDKYVRNGNELLLPINSIKQIGIGALEKIKLEREKSEFIDIFDFINRCYGKAVGKTTLESLIYAGCFDSLGYNRKTLINNLDIIINYGEIGSLLENQLKPIIEEDEEYKIEELLLHEFEVFGFYVSAHPITKYKIQYETIPIFELTKYLNNKVKILLMVSRKREIDTKNNDKMCFVTGVDEVDSLELVLFPKIYDKYNDVHPSDIIYVTGTVEKRFDKIQLIVDTIDILNNHEK